MVVHFDNLPSTARIWIYQANQSLNNHQVESMQKDWEQFLHTWQAHQKDLKAAINCFYNRFWVVGVDETFNTASGCSIDKQVNFVKGLEAKYQISLLDRSQIAFKQNENIFTIPFQEIEQAIQTGKITHETQIFNNSITQKQDLEKNWLQKVENSWLKRYFVAV
ncbi:MAG: hypothetical protein NZ516_10430 [Raineya sp.]|nr:hypothetical protein [Raineya sp.]